MADPVLTIPVVLDVSGVPGQAEGIRRTLEGAGTFAAEGRRTSPGSSASPVERTARAYDRSSDYSSLPQREGRAFVGGMPVGDQPLPFQREVGQYNLNKYRREERLESRVERYAAGLEADAARDENRQTREQDRNETRFSRSTDAAAFAEHRQQNRNEARYNRSSEAAAFATFRQNQRSESEATERSRVAAIEGTGNRARQWAEYYGSMDEKDRERRFNTPGYIPDDSRSPLTQPPQDELDARNARAAEYSAGPGGGYGGGAGIGAAYNRIVRGNTNFLNKNLSYFGRFMAVEGIRTATAIGTAYRNSAINVAEAQGDPTALANVDLRFREDIASAAPLGIGKLAQMIRDPSGHGDQLIGGIRNMLGLSSGRDYGELDVRQPLLDAASEDRISGVRAASSRNAFNIARATDVAGSGMGVTRQLMESTEQARQETDKAVVQGISTGLEEEKAHRARISSMETRYNARWENGVYVADDSAGFNKEYASEQASYSGPGGILSKASGRNAANLQNIQIANMFRQRDISAVASAGALGDIFGGALAYSQSRQLNPLSGDAAFSARSQLEAQQQQQNFANSRTNQDEDNAYAMASAKDPILAKFGRFAQMGGRALREKNLSISQDVQTRQLDRQQALTRLDIGGNSLQAWDTISRNPDHAIADAYQTSMAKAGLADPEFRGPLEANAAAQRDAASQSLSDRRSGTGGRLALAERTSGLLARAYGPGAQNFRDAAAVTSIAGSAEINAQDILRQDNTANGLAQADSARRTGINNLGAFRANYLEGFSAREGSLNRTALSTDSSSRPEITLRVIQAAEDALKGNLGSNNVGNVTRSAGTEAALLAQILTQLGNLVAGP